MSDLTIQPNSALQAHTAPAVDARRASGSDRPAGDAPITPVSPSETDTVPDSSASPSATDLLEAMKRVQDFIQPVARDLLFSIDDDTGHTVVKIVDRQTEEVIKQFPSEEFLAMARALDKLRGLLVKQEV